METILEELTGKIFVVMTFDERLLKSIVRLLKVFKLKKYTVLQIYQVFNFLA